MVEITKETVGSCGNACILCAQYEAHACGGCKKENAETPLCAIYKCVKDKGVDACLRCGDMPCHTLKAMFRGYCPVYGKIKNKL